MILTYELCKVIAEIENKIGSECYNGFSYDGWTNTLGCSFRYPLNFPQTKDSRDLVKTKDNLKYYLAPDRFPEDKIHRMRYKFGANELYIGEGIIKALKYLEDRYGLDFNELEAKKACLAAVDVPAKNDTNDDNKTIKYTITHKVISTSSVRLKREYPDPPKDQIDILVKEHNENNDFSKPIVVIPSGDKYILEKGYSIFYTAKLLGKTTIKAKIKTPIAT